MEINGINISQEFIEAEAKKWSVAEFAVFGSILTDSFSDKSDIDVLVTFKDNSKIGLFDLVAMREEFVSYFHRDVDIVEKAAIKNPYRRATILSNYKVLYVS